MMNNIYWVGNLNVIGGVETFIYELAKKFTNYDLTIYYNNIPPEQLSRLKKYVRCIKYNGEKLKCKKLFMNYDISIIDNVEAEEYIEVIHCVFKYNTLKPHTHSNITKYYAVSKEACESFKKITGEECEVLYNPLQVDKPKRILKLISATRLSKDKGKLVERIQTLVNELEKNNIPYEWKIFTNDKDTITGKGIIFMKPTLDIRDYIADSDYLVQLSDTEAFCYSVLESLYLNTPVIVTPIPCFINEMKIQDGINGYILDFDMTKIPVKEIYNKIPKFTYTPFKDKWDDVIIKKKGNYQEYLKTKARCRCIFEKGYDDIELNKHIEYNEELPLIHIDRAKHLEQLKLIEILEVINE